MILKPARSRAREAAASWVTTFRAVAAFLDHPDDPADLSLGAAEPFDHIRHRLAVHVHGGSP